MRNQPLHVPFNSPFLRYAPLSAAMACTLLAACTDDASPGLAQADTQAESSGQADPQTNSAAQADAPVSRATLQRDVDIVLAATSAFEDALGDAAPALGPAYLRLAHTLEAVALVAEDLRNLDRDADLRQLSQRAAQLAPQLRKLKRALAKAEIAPALRGDLLVRVARIRVAARAFDLHASELHRQLDRGRADALGIASRDLDALSAGTLGPDAFSADALNPDARRTARNRAFGPLFLLDQGHVDAIDAEFEDGALGLSVHDESAVPDVERDPASVIFVVKSAAKIQLPDERFAFLGPVGATVWLLPQDQLDAEAAGVLFLGLSSEEIEPGIFVGDSLDVRFRHILGPNGLSLFESPEDETSPPHILVDSEDNEPDIVALPASTHKHANWAFESAGIYAITVDVTGRLAGIPGEPRITSSKALLKFVVLP